MYGYLDASAIVKLAVEEAESEALRREVAASLSRVTTSVVGDVEARRAVRRSGDDPTDVERLAEVLGALDTIGLTQAIRQRAGSLDPPELRALDAIHLASALSLGDDLEAFVCYDARLADAAAAHGLPVLAPA